MYSIPLFHAYPTIKLSSHQFLNLQARKVLNHNFIPCQRLPFSVCQKLERCPLICSATSTSFYEGWEKWVPKDMVAADKVLRLIAGATSSPIYQFIASPTTFLHSVDSRIKLAWLVALIIVPARSNVVVRFGVVMYLALLSILVLPKEVWMDQLGKVTLLSGILFVMLGLGAEGVTPVAQLRTPPPSMTGLSNIPPSLTGYSYVMMKLGPLMLTRKGFSTAAKSACLTFTILQSASICLATTTPERLAFALQWFINPLRHFGVPVAETILTLLLSLRFLNLVFDEVRNIALGIVCRRINWQQLTVMETIDVFVNYVRRFFKNIFNHTQQISQAMMVRGFRGESDLHRIYFPSDSSNLLANILSMVFLFGLVGATIASEYLII